MKPRTGLERPGSRRTERVRGFRSIYEAYKSFYDSLRTRGLMPYALTSGGAWAASRPVHVFRFFELVGLESYRRVFDLGSGDGIVTHVASLFTSATGIEIDEALCGSARRISKRLNLPHPVRFLCEDFTKSDLSSADCLYIYPDKPVQVLERRLGDWQGTVLIYGPHFKPLTLTPIKEFKCGRERLMLYRRRLS